VVIEAIKLVEGGLADLCDEVWLVTCDAATQRERLVGRGDAEHDAAARVAAQGDLVGRLRPRATWVLDTSGPPQATRRRVMETADSVLSSTA
jgi:dephospho-CoA kinase